MQAKPYRRPLRLHLRAALAMALVVLSYGFSHTLVWWWLAQRLEVGLADWALARRAEGWQVAHGPPARGGWPWAATLTVPELRLADAGGLGWQAARLELRLALPWPNNLAFSASGQQELTFGGLVLPFTAASLIGSLPQLPASPPPPLRLQAEAVQAEGPAGPMTLRRATLGLAQQGGGTLLDLTMEGLAPAGLPPAAAAMLGPEVQRLAVRAALLGGRPGAAPLAQQAAAWQQAGGRLDVQELDLRWGPFQAGGSGELALDPALQPSGRGTLTLAGMAEVLDAAVGARLLPQQEANALRALGALLQRPAADGGPPRLNLPLMLRDRNLSVAGFTLLRLAPLQWPTQ